MAKPILIANWKNHPSSLSLAKALLTQLSRNSRIYKKLSFFIAPPLVYLESVLARSRSFFGLASQDIFVSSGKGSYTGEVSLDILKSFGVKVAIVGHSEQRALGQTSEDVANKVKISLRSGIMPIVCVGELSRDHDGGYFEFLRQQMKLSLSGISRKDISKLTIAYEPVWAIGKHSKDSIEPSDLAQTVIFIRKVLADLFGRASAERVPIIYGGSVEVSNAESLFKETGISGFLVGHASLNAKSLKSIAEALISK